MTSDETTRAEEEAVTSVTSNETDNPGGDHEVANTSPTGDTEPKIAAGKTGKKKNQKKAKKAASSLVDGTATAAKSQGSAQKPGETAHDKWHQAWRLLYSDPKMVTEKERLESHAFFKEMLARTVEYTAPGGNIRGPLGPVCANPRCGAFGHTLAVCPVPTHDDEGDMTGCFFCNVADHDADDCAMMKWVSPATLVTHLITNRASMPPWNTRINWVALAIDQWDLVCFTMLPLTRAFVKKVYIPGKRWTEVNGVSPITDPLFKNASLRLLKTLSKPKGDDQLMEASRILCYRKSNCVDGFEHTVFKNDLVSKYIPKEGEVDPRLIADISAYREHDLAAAELQFTKKMPKKVTKERKGRRAMKREAAAAAAPAATEEAAADSGKPQCQNEKEESSSSSEGE
ncbi:hypothetical protein VTG60DRAFT_4830 [Thermothelomyces hinnuleus]